MSDMISRKDAIAAIVDVQSRTDAIVFGNSIHRPPVSVQEAAKVLLMIENMDEMVDAAKKFNVYPMSLNAILRAIAEGGEA